MWTCSNCGRIFEKAKQPHSCRRVPLEQHFRHKDQAKALFDHLLARLNQTVGHCQIVSLPCCVHVFGMYDFLAALPKKDRLEIRFALDRVIDSPRLKVSVPLSAKSYKNCVDIAQKQEVDAEFIGWLTESYHRKD